MTLPGAHKGATQKAFPVEAGLQTLTRCAAAPSKSNLHLRRSKTTHADSSVQIGLSGSCHAAQPNLFSMTSSINSNANAEEQLLSLSWILDPFPF